MKRGMGPRKKGGSVADCMKDTTKRACEINCKYEEREKRVTYHILG